MWTQVSPSPSPPGLRSDVFTTLCFNNSRVNSRYEAVSRAHCAELDNKRLSFASRRAKHRSALKIDTTRAKKLDYRETINKNRPLLVGPETLSYLPLSSPPSSSRKRNRPVEEPHTKLDNEVDPGIKRQRSPGKPLTIKIPPAAMLSKLAGLQQSSHTPYPERKLRSRWPLPVEEANSGESTQPIMIRIPARRSNSESSLGPD